MRLVIAMVSKLENAGSATECAAVLDLEVSWIKASIDELSNIDSTSSALGQSVRLFTWLSV